MRQSHKTRGIDRALCSLVARIGRKNPKTHGWWCGSYQQMRDKMCLMWVGADKMQGCSHWGGPEYRDALQLKMQLNEIIDQLDQLIFGHEESI